MDPDVDRVPDADVEELLRRALSAPADNEDRVVRAALAAGRAERASLASRPALTAAALLLLLAVFAVVIFRGARQPAAPAVVRGLVTNDGAVVIIRAPDQPTIFIGPGGEPPNLPPGAGSIVLLGEGQ